MFKHLNILKEFLFAITPIIVSSCNHNLDNLAKNVKSGVVLIQTVEYYEMVMDNNSTLYFTGSDFNKETGEFIGLTTDLDSLIPDIMYGTGFFISEDGRIATNRHVIEGNIKEKDARSGLRKIIQSLEEALMRAKEHYELCLMDIGVEIASNPDTIPGFLQAQMDARELFSLRLQSIKQMIRALQYNDITLKYHNDVRIAYNNTFTSSSREFKPCTIRKKSDKDDLAIIQLNTKQTPEGRHIFKLSPKDMIHHYSYGEFLMHLIKKDKNKHLMMIGYNYGLNMANTDEGISAQHQIGTISRYLADERDFLYNIPALVGSSGSPVINRRGQVVAINYASADTSNNRFNYGVKEKYLYELNKSI